MLQSHKVCCAENLNPRTSSKSAFVEVSRFFSYPPELPPAPAALVLTRIVSVITNFKKFGFYKDACSVRNGCK